MRRRSGRMGMSNIYSCLSGATVWLNATHAAVLFAGFALVITGAYITVLPQLVGGSPLLYSGSYLILGTVSAVFSAGCWKKAGWAYLGSCVFGTALIGGALALYSLRVVPFDPLDYLEIPLDAGIGVLGAVVYLRFHCRIGSKLSHDPS